MMNDQGFDHTFPGVIERATEEDEKQFELARQAMARSRKYPDRYPSIGTVDGSLPDHHDFQTFRNQAMTSLDLWPTENNFDFWMDCVADLYLPRALEAMGDFKLAMETSSTRRKQQMQTED